MAARGRLWPAAVLASLLAHGVLIGVLALAVDPVPTAPQETPRTRLAISTQTVESRAAPPAAHATERAEEPPPDSARMDSAAVPVSRARPAAPVATDAAALPPAGTPLAPRADPALAATGVRLPAGDRLAPVQRNAEAVGAAALAAVLPDMAAPERPVRQTARPAAAPTSARARPVDPSKAQALTQAPDRADGALLAPIPAIGASRPPIPAVGATQPSIRADGARQAPISALGASQRAAVAPDAIAAPGASAQGARVDAATARGNRVAAAPAPREASASVTAPDSAPASVATAQTLHLAALEGAGQGAAQPPSVPQAATARAAPVTPDTGTAVPLAGLSRRAQPAPRLPAFAATAAVSGQRVGAARPPPAAGQTLEGRDPGTLAARAAPAAPGTTRVTSALAWSGAADGGAIDPVSLAAIQSFLQPSDRANGESAVRDGISGLLAAVPCARLQTVFDPESGLIELRGHIPEARLRDPVLAALRAQVGASIPLADNMLVLPRPTCGALSGIASIGLAQSREQTRDPRIVGPTAHARVYRFVDGDRLSFELTGPDYPAYFYIDYFDADGMVLHLQPNEIVPLARIGAKEKLVVGAGATGQPRLDIRVSPPFGQEIMVAFATSVPLHDGLQDGLRPIREPAGPYLEFLRARVAQARRAHPDFKGEWVYFFVSTRAQ